MKVNLKYTAVRRNISVEIHQDFGGCERLSGELASDRFFQEIGHPRSHGASRRHQQVENSKLTIWSSSQSPHYFQCHIARVFGLRWATRVIKAFVGGGLWKLEPSAAEYVSAAGYENRPPVGSF
jgi:4-hydroxybenzoyl-CoA reductase subunit alpha